MFTGRTVVVDKVFCQFKVDGDELHESDIIWMFDMIKELGVEHHNMETCAPQDILDSSEMVFNATEFAESTTWSKCSTRSKIESRDDRRKTFLTERKCE